MRAVSAYYGVWRSSGYKAEVTIERISNAIDARRRVGFSEDFAISPKEFLLEKQRIQMLSEFLSNDRALREVAKLVDFYQKPFRLS